MYSIVNVVYGVPCNDQVRESFSEEQLEEMGFEFLYHGNASHSPGFFGAELCVFDECVENLDVDSLKLIPNESQKQEVLENFDKLPSELKRLLPSIKTYFVFSSS